MPKALSQKRIDATIFLPTPRVITASELLKSLPPTTKSYPFLSQRDLQGNDSCPENLYVIAIFNYKLEFIKVRISTFKTLAISFSCATEGCDLLWHHREIVCAVLPSCSASQRLFFLVLQGQLECDLMSLFFIICHKSFNY